MSEDCSPVAAAGQPRVEPGSPCARTRSAGRRAVGWLAYGYALLMAAIVLADAIGPERFWWSSLNLYLPQWLWAFPALVLVPACLLVRPWLAAGPAVCAAISLGPLCGLRLPLAQPAQPGAGDVRLRVMTYNVKYGRGNVAAIRSEVERANPDIVLLQDAGELLPWFPAAFPGRYVGAAGQYLVISRYPLADVELRPMPGSRDDEAVGWTYLRMLARVGARSVTLYDIHLLTPREGLRAVRREHEDGLADLEANVAMRLYQSEVVAQAVRRDIGPVILAGDLNAPDVSLVCRRLRAAGLRDAFEEAGRGYGFTWGHSVWPHTSYLRIDHVLLGSGLRAFACRTGGSAGSEHRPVIADLVLEAERRGR